MKKYYIISVETGEYGQSQRVRICESFEEAKSHIMEYRDWWGGKGTCFITEEDEECNHLQVWFFRNGEQTSYFDHRHRQ